MFKILLRSPHPSVGAPVSNDQNPIHVTINCLRHLNIEIWNVLSASGLGFRI